MDKAASLDATAGVSSDADLEIAVRVYPDEASQSQTRKSTPRPQTSLVFDCETSIDAAQRLTFGGYRFYENQHCVEEGLFYGDDLPAAKRRTLERYVADNVANTNTTSNTPLKLYSRDEFVQKVFYKAAFKARSMVVCFNMPFDISRLAVGCGEARFRRRRDKKSERQFDYAGGFSFVLWRYRKNGEWCESRYRPRIRIKSIDSKRALKAFTRPEELDEEDKIPDWASDGEPDKSFTFRGHLLDLRTLAFALTDKGYSLEQACQAFGVEHGKIKPAKHGDVTSEYIDYSRRDVLATSELLFKILEELDKHPIDLQPTRAYSPASVGKAYLRAMGVRPALLRQPKFDKPALGHAMVAFFGGRAECKIRRTPVPVVYLDFLSMYPTVNALMGLWKLVTAKRISIKPDITGVHQFLDNLGAEDLFLPDTWKQLVGIAEIEPVNDILPIRANYEKVNKGWQIGINRLITGRRRDPLWFTFADLAASKLLTGKTPKLLRAIRFSSIDVQDGLEPVNVRGAVLVNPITGDFFKTCIQERKLLDRKGDLKAEERDRLDLFLKILTNATSYGINAEIIRHELPGKRKEATTIYGLTEEALTVFVRAIEEPGEFCFPPLAACITGAARLQLALLERCVADAGGSFAMCDTDSMAIVATKDGGPIPCIGGARRSESDETINALSWAQVEDIRQRFARLNPYDRRAIPGSTLDLEGENFDPATGQQRQLWCLAISAKRYALYVLNSLGEPEVLQKGINSNADGWSEHGLGHLLNPIDPDSEDSRWIRQAWEAFIREAMGLPLQRPDWLSRPAVGRITVSSPLIFHAFDKLNDPKHPYSDWVKPFNFILSAHVAPFGHPIGAEPEKFHLVAPYNPDPKQWTKLRWIDMYSQKTYQINTSTRTGGEGFARVKTYGEVLDDYRYHPEAKSLANNGKPCGREDVGFLKRRQVAPFWIRYIGKESNDLEAAAAGVIHDPSSVYDAYVDPSRSYWLEVILPILRKIPLRLLIEKSGMSASTLKAIRRDEDPVIPHQRNREKLARISLEWAR